MAMCTITQATWAAEPGKLELLQGELTAYVKGLASAAHEDVDAFVLAGKSGDEYPVFCTLIAVPGHDMTTARERLDRLGYKGLQARCFSQGLIRHPVVDRTLEPFSGFLYRLGNLSPRSFAVVAELKYKPGQRAQGEGYWMDIATYADAQEPGTYSYIWSRDKDYDDVLWSFERYESEEYLWKTHVADSEPVQRSLRLQKEFREKTTHGYFQTRCCVVHKKYYAA